MKTRINTAKPPREIKRIGILFTIVLLPAYGQWLNYPSPGTPRTRDGKPNLSAPAPRVKGRPDLSGVWQIQPEPALLAKEQGAFDVPGDDTRGFSRYFIDVLADFKPGEEPLRPEAAAALRNRRVTGSTKEHPNARCLPFGLPGTLVLGMPFRIQQSPVMTLMLFEVENSFREIYTDGRPLPKDPQPAWRGYSIGKWEGDVFVVETAGFNDRAWLDVSGNTHSDALRMQERYQRRDFGHMDVAVTMDDPKTFRRPVTIKFSELLIPDSDVLEYICGEDEKDTTHMGLK
jgi:hypothetical protein